MNNALVAVAKKYKNSVVWQEFSGHFFKLPGQAFARILEEPGSY